jgi:hypothetical protein
VKRSSLIPNGAWFPCQVLAARRSLPGRLIVHAIEAADLTQGLGLTPPVAEAVGTVALAILDDIRGFPVG